MWNPAFWSFFSRGLMYGPLAVASHVEQLGVEGRDSEPGLVGV